MRLLVALGLVLALAACKTTPDQMAAKSEDSSFTNVTLRTSNPDTISQVMREGLNLGEEEISARLYLPEVNGPFPVVVMQHGTGEVHNISLAVSEMSAQLKPKGIAIFVPDSYGGRGIRNKKLNTASRFVDAISTLKFLSEHPKIDEQRIGFTGYSYGGYIAHLVNNKAVVDRFLPNTDGYAAVAPVYPSCTLSWAEQNPNGPTMFVLGKKDNWTYPAPCRELANRMEATGSEVVVVEYDAHHGWMGNAYSVESNRVREQWKDDPESCGTGRIDADGYFSWGGASEKQSGWDGFIADLRKQDCFEQGVL